VDPATGWILTTSTPIAAAVFRRSHREAPVIVDYSDPKNIHQIRHGMSGMLKGEQFGPLNQKVRTANSRSSMS
jgi:hypothetical protein